MTPNFQPGRYKTWSGFDAVVTRIRMTGGEWVLCGAIHIPDSNIDIIHHWRTSGQSWTDASCNLSREENLQNE